MNFEDLIEVKKGTCAEFIMNRYLRSKGYIVYSPINLGRHPFDSLAVKDKEEFMIAECKGKPKLIKYNATGIDINDFNYYKRLSLYLSIPVFIFFVDQDLEEMYGNYLPVLMDNSFMVPWANGLILFDMNCMERNLYMLNQKEVESLKNI